MPGKLTEDNIHDIVFYAAEGVPQKRIAEHFGVSEATVSDILTGKRWTQFTGLSPVESGRMPKETPVAERVRHALRNAVPSSPIFRQEKPCLLAQVRPVGKRHPQITIKGKFFLLYRLVFAEEYGRDVNTLGWVLHRCGRGKDGCIEPTHLYEGSPADNSRDMIEHGNSAKGERQHNAKLTAEEVYIIRSLASQGLSYKRIAEKFEVSSGHICRIVHRGAWKHLPPFAEAGQARFTKETP